MAKRSSSPFREIPFPLDGISVHSGFTHQDPGTAADALNVRGYDPTTNALRGAQRCGHSKYLSGTTGSSIQHINHVIQSAGVTGASARTLTAIAVSSGSVYTFSRSGSFTLATNGSGALSSTNPYIQSCILSSKIYFADGTTWKYFDPTTNTVTLMVATAGALPVDGSGRAPRLIVDWRGRLVWSGLQGDPQNWFMSKVFTPLDYDYSPAITTATQAVAGNNTEAGLVPDIINGMCAFSDDLLIFFGDHSIFQMTEDPAAGGQIDRITDTVGAAFGKAWCKDASGVIYFVGSRGGFYRMTASQTGVTSVPERISAKRIDELLLTIDFSANVIRMEWDDRFQSVMFYVTPVAGGTTTNWCYDVRNDAFWKDEFGNTNHQPTAVHLMDGDTVDDRVFLLGCYDGYIRFIDLTAKTDDGTGILSYAYIGPLQGDSGKLRMRELRVIMGENSDPCSMRIYAGHSPEHAFISENALWTETVAPGRNPAFRPLITGQAFYLVPYNKAVGSAWQWETAYVEMQSLGHAAGRML